MVVAWLNLGLQKVELSKLTYSMEIEMRDFLIEFKSREEHLEIVKSSLGRARSRVQCDEGGKDYSGWVRVVKGKLQFG